jgi:hypothetical protein
MMTKDRDTVSNGNKRLFDRDIGWIRRTKVEFDHKEPREGERVMHDSVNSFYSCDQSDCTGAGSPEELICMLSR